MVLKKHRREKKKKKTTKQKTSPEAAECRQYFYDQFMAVRKRPYNPNFSKDIVLFHLLLKNYPISWIKGMIDFYLRWDDPWVAGAGRTAGVFYSQVNKMLELNIHKSFWVEKHLYKYPVEKEKKPEPSYRIDKPKEEPKFHSVGEVLKNILQKRGKDHGKGCSEDNSSAGDKGQPDKNNQSDSSPRTN